MTAADERYHAECRERDRVDYADICNRLDREHAKNPAANPTYGMTAWQIRHEEAVMAGPHGPYPKDEEEND